MSFAGYHLSSTSKTSIETAESELAHLSRVCLTEHETPCKYQVRIEDDSGKVFCLGVLTDRFPQIELEHYVQNGSKVWLEGKGDAKADLTGYVEPTYALSDAEEDDDEDVCCDGEMSSDSEAMEAAEKSGESTNDNFTSANASEESEEEQEVAAEVVEEMAADLASSAEEPEIDSEGDSDDDDEDDEDDDDDDEDEDTETALPAGFEFAVDSDDNEEDASSEVAEVVKKKVGKKESVKKDKIVAAPSESGKKRKADKCLEAPVAKKKSTPETEFERALVEELKRMGGRTKISILGAKVQRPQGVSSKLGAFLKERSQIFVCDGPNVSIHPSLQA